MAMGAQQMVLHRFRGITVEVYAKRTLDALPDDVVELW